MKANKKTKGFTLIEMLIVLGIIGVLSAVMLGMFNGSGEAARATQCMTNMRGLSVAVLNYAMQNRDGIFPTAGSLKYKSYVGGISYPERGGWVSWNKGGGGSGSPACPSYITFAESDVKTLRYAVTNGCIWSTGGKSEKSYLCPVHDAACLKANKNRHPGWSYVMNESFYWNSLGKPHGSWVGIGQGSMHVIDTENKNNRAGRPPEKVLLFAEIQGLTDEKRGLVANTAGAGNKGDGVLQYSKENEAMGFNHRQSGGGLAGHVAFADGHVEKLMYPANGDVKQLTKWLGSGREVSFNGSNYQDLQR